MKLRNKIAFKLADLYQWLGKILSETIEDTLDEWIMIKLLDFVYFLVKIFSDDSDEEI